jgi:hypothetical protein
MTALTKHDLISKFAQQTGADVPGVPKAPTPSPAPQMDDIHFNTEPATPQPTEAISEPVEASDAEPELFKDSFSDRTKQKPWEGSRYRSMIVALCVVPVLSGVAWFFRDGLPKPQFGVKRPAASTVADADTDKPKPATDGQWAGLAATNGMHQQFTSAPAPNGPPVPHNFKPGATVGKGKVGPAAGQKTPGSRAVTMRPRSMPMDYDSRPLTHSYTPSVSYPRAPIASYSHPTYRAAPAYSPRPAISSPRPASAAPRNTPSTVEQEKSAQDRWLALSTGTSAQSSSQTGNNGNPSGSGQSLGNPSPSAPTQSGQPIAATAPSPAQSSRSAYTTQNAAYLPSESSVIDGQPQTLIHRSAKAKGRLVSGIAFTPGSLAALNGQPIEIEITDTLDSQIPKGARIVAVVDANNADGSGSYGIRSSAIRLVPTALAMGDTEVPIDGSAISITGNNGKPLLAKAPDSGFLKTLGGILGTAVQGVGLANGGAGQNASFGNGTYLSSIGANIGTTLFGNATQRLQQSGSQQSVLILPEQTEIQLNILKPLSLPLLGVQGAVPSSESPEPPNAMANGFAEPTDAVLYSLVQQEQAPEQQAPEQQSTQEVSRDVQ